MLYSNHIVPLPRHTSHIFDRDSCDNTTTHLIIPLLFILTSLSLSLCVCVCVFLLFSFFSLLSFLSLFFLSLFPSSSPPLSLSLTLSFTYKHRCKSTTHTQRYEGIDLIERSQMFCVHFSISHQNMPIHLRILSSGCN